LGVTGVAPQAESAPPSPEPPLDEPEPAIVIAPPDEPEPAIMTGAPEELDPPVIVTPEEPDPPVIVAAPDELELGAPVPVMPGEPDPPEPDDGGVPEPTPLLDPPVELDVLVLEPDELDPLAALEPGSEEPGLLPWFPVESVALPHPATAPASPHRTAKVVRVCIASPEQ